MKFKIRPGYAVHLTKVRVIEQNGRKVKSAAESSFWEGEIVDLTPDEANDHLAKLEPADKESAAFLAPKAA